MIQINTLGEAISALRRRFWVIFAVVIAGAALSLYFALSQTKVYQATSVVQIEAASVSNQAISGTIGVEDTSRSVRLIEQRMMARDHVVELLDRYQLFLQAPSVLERVALMRQAVSLEEIKDNTRAWAPGGSQPSGLLINVRLSDPQKAAMLANELMDFVIGLSHDRTEDRAQQAYEFYNAEEARISTAIEANDTALAEFKRQNAEGLPSGISDLRTQLTALKTTDLDLDRQLLALESSTARQRAEVKAREQALLQEQKLLIAERVSQIDALLAAAPDVERELSKLERERDRLREQYAAITSNKANAELGRHLKSRENGGGFAVLEEALVPEYPISRSRKNTALMGLMVSIMAGLGVAYLLEVLNPVIRTSAQLERAAGVTPVISVPTLARPKGKPHPQSAPPSGMRARLMRLPILGELFQKKRVDI